MSYLLKSLDEGWLQYFSKFLVPTTIVMRKSKNKYFS
jgi:hypothetical protein